MEPLLWQRGDRKLVVHYHLFKNAGTSVDFLLERAFLSWEDWTEGATAYLSPNHLAAHVGDRDVEAISSHTLRPAAPIGYDVFPIIIVRHPLDRAYSVFQHERRCPPNVLSCHVARATDFRGYVEWCLNHPTAGGVVILDYQTGHLGEPRWRGHVYNVRPGDIELQRAKMLLDTLPIPAVVEGFDSFVARFRPALENWLGKPVEMPATAWENRSGLPTRKLEDRVAHLEDLLGQDLAARFYEANACDYRLYQHALRLVQAHERFAEKEIERNHARAKAIQAGRRRRTSRSVAV